MATYSVSQKRFIDDTPQMGGSGGNLDSIISAYEAGNFGTPGSTQAGRYLTQLEQLGLIGKNTQGTQDEDTKKISNRIAILERLWFPNEDKLALPEQTNIIGRQVHKYSKMFEGSSEYEQFRRYARTLGATLAKAAGDTGNIAWAEQAAQLQALADADLTKEEAEQSFRNIREGLGLGEVPSNYYNKLRSSKTDNKDITKVANKSLTEMDTDDNGKPKQKQTPVDKRNLLQRIINTGDTSVPVDIPKPLNISAETIGGIGAGFTKNPAVGGVLQGVGNWLDQLREKGIPLTREEANKSWGKPSLLPNKSEIEAGVATGKGVLTSALLHPLSTLGGARKAFLNRAMSMGAKLPETSIIPEAGIEFATKVARPEQAATARKMALEDINRFGAGGKFNLSQLLEEATKRGQGAFTKSQELLSKNPAAYNAYIRDAINSQVSKISPTAGAITKGLGKVYQAKNTATNLASTIAKYAILSRIFGGGKGIGE